MSSMTWQEREQEEIEAVARVTEQIASTRPAARMPPHAPQMPITKALLPSGMDIRELALHATPAAMQALYDIVSNEEQTATARISAATALLDRGHGKPHQSLNVQGGLTFNLICAIPAAPNSIKTIDHEAISSVVTSPN